MKGEEMKAITCTMLSRSIALKVSEGRDTDWLEWSKVVLKQWA